MTEMWNWFEPIPCGNISDVNTCIDKQVCKRSGKPFKSTNKVNTVKSVTTNPNTNLIAFSFYEDESIVDAHQCKLLED